MFDKETVQQIKNRCSDQNFNFSDHQFPQGKAGAVSEGHCPRSPEDWRFCEKLHYWLGHLSENICKSARLPQYCNRRIVAEMKTVAENETDAGETKSEVDTYDIEEDEVKNLTNGKTVAPFLDGKGKKEIMQICKRISVFLEWKNPWRLSSCCVYKKCVIILTIIRSAAWENTNNVNVKEPELTLAVRKCPVTEAESHAVTEATENISIRTNGTHIEKDMKIIAEHFNAASNEQEIPLSTIPWFDSFWERLLEHLECACSTGS